MSQTNDRSNLGARQGYFSSAHAGFNAYSKFLRDNFDPRHANFIVSSISSANTLDLSGSDSEVEFIEAIEIPLLPKRRRSRTNFDTWQVDELENVFKTTQYPDVFTREALSLKLDLLESRIQVWFQNRRARMRREDKIKSAPGRRRKSETDRSNRAFLLSHVNQTAKKKTKNNPNSNTQRTEASHQKSSFTIESILSRKDPPKERLSTVAILSNLVDGIPAEEGIDEEEMVPEETPPKSSNDSSTPITTKRKTSNGNVTTVELSEDTSEVTHALTSSSHGLSKLSKDSGNSLGSETSLGGKRESENTPDQRHESLAAPALRNSRQNDDYPTTQHLASNSSSASVAFATSCDSSRYTSASELSERARSSRIRSVGLVSGNSSCGAEEKQLPKRQYVVPLYLETTLQTGQHDKERSTVIHVATSRNITHELARTGELIHPLSENSSERSHVIDNCYEQNPSASDVIANRSLWPSEQELNRNQSLQRRVILDATLGKDGHQFNDFESFRTTSILTLRNRAEKHVQRFNVCL